jgi:hypothetical protein
LFLLGFSLPFTCHVVERCTLEPKKGGQVRAVMKSSSNLIGIEFRPKLMLHIWENLLNLLEKRPKTLVELADIAVGADRRVMRKEYNLPLSD